MATRWKKVAAAKVCRSSGGVEGDRRGQRGRSDGQNG